MNKDSRDVASIIIHRGDVIPVDVTDGRVMTDSNEFNTVIGTVMRIVVTDEPSNDFRVSCHDGGFR